MSDESNEQAVATEPNAGATPPADGGGAQEQSVDELLSEFDAGNTKEPTDEKQPVPKEESDGKVEFTPSQRKELLDELRTDIKVEEELKTAVKEIKGDLDIEDNYVRWRLEELAKNDERVWKAFIARKSNPKAWSAVSKKLNKELSDKYGKPATGTDKEQIASAVHSATQTSGAPSGEVDIKKMSDADFEMQKYGIMQRAIAGNG